MHKYPVIHVSFKDIVGKKSKDDESLLFSAVNSLKYLISETAKRYLFLLESKELNEDDRISFEQIKSLSTPKESKKDEDMELEYLAGSLKKLSELLEKHYGFPTVILIDEYDVLLNKAFKLGYYQDFIETYRCLLSSALKGNPSLAFAVVTGCLRISKESIFTGLNNLRVYDVTSPGLDEWLGFRDEDVYDMLEYYGLSQYHADTKSFYDGYRFASQLVYNPWSINTFVSKAIESREKNEPVTFQCDWLDTSENDILNELVERSANDRGMVVDIGNLALGKSVSKKIISQLTFESIYKDNDALWTVMLHSGYVTCEENLGQTFIRLRIPNEEVHQAFDDKIVYIAKRDTGRGRRLKEFCDAIATFDPNRIEKELNNILRRTTSIRDNATKAVHENYYHGIMNAALLYRDDWQRWSNPETGDGYCDIMAEGENGDWAVLFELKYSNSASDFSAALAEAKGQIYRCDYAQILMDNDYPKAHMYAIAFHGKKCKVEEVALPLRDDL